MSTNLQKLIREIRSLQAERDLARSIAHARGLDVSELEAQNRRLREVVGGLMGYMPLTDYGIKLKEEARRALEPKP